MSYPIELREKAIALRKQGHSLEEVARTLRIAKSTSSLWLNSIELNHQAQAKLRNKQMLGQYKSRAIQKIKKDLIKTKILENTLKEFSDIQFNKSTYKLLCSIFYWTEGGKYSDSYVYFMNSDPKMIEVFMKLLRLAYPLDEKKFRALIHVHEYHNQKQIKKFWSKVTRIPLSQFSKSYLKVNTGKRIRDNYQGCIRIRYYDYQIALELRSFYNTLVQTI